MRTQSTAMGRLVGARLDTGEDLLRSLRATVQEHGIRNGVILGGVGSLSRYRFHVVETTNMPPGDRFVEGEGPFDIVQLSGLVLEGRLHAHITFSNIERALGGHLEEGCIILTFAVVTLAELPGADLSGWDRIGKLF